MLAPLRLSLATQRHVQTSHHARAWPKVNCDNHPCWPTAVLVMALPALLMVMLLCSPQHSTTSPSHRCSWSFRYADLMVRCDSKHTSSHHVYIHSVQRAAIRGSGSAPTPPQQRDTSRSNTPLDR